MDADWPYGPLYALVGEYYTRTTQLFFVLVHLSKKLTILFVVLYQQNAYYFTTISCHFLTDLFALFRQLGRPLLLLPVGSLLLSSTDTATCSAIPLRALEIIGIGDWVVKLLPGNE
jgi:hypothetical protein